jgi:hypothetical protein
VDDLKLLILLFGGGVVLGGIAAAAGDAAVFEATGIEDGAGAGVFGGAGIGDVLECGRGFAVFVRVHVSG